MPPGDIPIPSIPGENLPPTPPTSPPFATPPADQPNNTSGSSAGPAIPQTTELSQPEVTTVEDAEADRKEPDAAIVEGIKDGPLLREGSVIQGPNDRKNRPATAEEIALSKQFHEDGLTDQEREDIANQRPKVPDIEIDKSAPPDVPANPRKVAESRGIVFTDKDPNAEVSTK
jgi:hypothetical protein